MKRTVKTLKSLTVIGVMLLLANSQSKAGTDLPSVSGGFPDLTGQYIAMSYNYDAGTQIGVFSANGWTTDYTDPSGNDMGGVLQEDVYTLSATFDNSGGSPLLTSGTLSISGDVGAGDTLLLSGDLIHGAAGTAFGYGDLANDLFQFKFTVSGGSLSDAFGGTGAGGGISFDAWFDSGSGDHPFTGSWTTEFDSMSSSVGDMDCFSMVPEPSSILFVLVGSILFVGGYRCRRSALRV